MNNAEKEAVLYCLKSMIDEEVCEECPLYGTTGTDHCEKDCVRLAINALEQEPCEDCISRQAVLKQLKGCLTGGETEYQYVKLHIDSIPPVIPQPKTGQREWVQYDGNPNIRNWYCSECRAIVNYKPTYNWEKKPYYKFCPNCGAKME